MLATYEQKPSIHPPPSLPHTTLNKATFQHILFITINPDSTKDTMRRNTKLHQFPPSNIVGKSMFQLCIQHISNSPLGG